MLAVAVDDLRSLPTLEEVAAGPSARQVLCLIRHAATRLDWELFVAGPAVLTLQIVPSAPARAWLPTARLASAPSAMRSLELEGL